MTVRHFFRQATLAAVLGVLCTGPMLTAQRVDYVTEEEEDLIRDAQGLKARVPVFLKLLDNRIVALGLRERTAKEREKAKEDLAKWEREAKEASKVEGAELRARPLKPDIYLRNATRSELLRGYMQIVDELMDNMEDAYDRKLPVRDHVEALEKFITEQLPRLRKFEPQNSSEASLIKVTVAHSEQALTDCRDALKLLPKTEKSIR